MKEKITALIILCMVLVPFTLCGANAPEPVPVTTATEPEIIIKTLSCYVPDDIEQELFYDSLDLLAHCVEAEAGDQGLMGKRYVVDVILNRVDSSDFPNTIEEVIYQSNAFEVVATGAIDRVTVSEETYEAINLELDNRLNYDILYFRTDYYHSFGTAWKQVGDHYFNTD